MTSGQLSSPEVPGWLASARLGLAWVWLASPEAPWLDFGLISAWLGLDFGLIRFSLTRLLVGFGWIWLDSGLA